MSKKNTTQQDSPAVTEGAPVLNSLKAERVQEPLAAPLETLETVKTGLKAERVQEPLLAKVDARLKAERVQERLKQMPGWGLLQGGRGIDRVKNLGTAECAADYAGFVLRHAARNKQEVRVELRGPRLHLAVFAAPHSGGISDKHLDFAAALG